MSEEKIKYYAKEFMYTDTKEIQILQPYIMIEIINLLQQENKELKKYKKANEEAKAYMTNYIELEDRTLNNAVFSEFEEVLDILDGGNNE